MAPPKRFNGAGPKQHRPNGGNGQQAQPHGDEPAQKKCKRYANGVEPEAPTPETNAAAIKHICSTLSRYNVIWKGHGIEPRSHSAHDLKRIVGNMMAGAMGLGNDHQCVRELDSVDFRGGVMVTKFVTWTAAELLLSNASRLKGVGDGRIHLQKDKSRTELQEESSCKSLAFFATLASDTHRYFMLKGPKIGSAPIRAPRDTKPLEVFYAGDFEIKHEALISEGRVLAKKDPKAMQKKQALLRQQCTPTEKPAPPPINARDPRSGASQQSDTPGPSTSAGVPTTSGGNGGNWQTVRGRNKSKRRANTAPDTPRAGNYKEQK